MIRRLDSGGSTGTRAMPVKGVKGTSSTCQNREVASRVVAASA
ncbi:unnamed protein product, partial [Amoebophrya sp. A120]|eukprot:GSA120T00020866001.1